MLRIKHKFFLAISLANLLLIGGLFTLASYSFQQSFRDYIDDTKAIELEPIIKGLTEKIDSEGWDWLDGPRAPYWRELMEDYHQKNPINDRSFRPHIRGSEDNRIRPSSRRPPPSGEAPPRNREQQLTDRRTQGPRLRRGDTKRSREGEVPPRESARRPTQKPLFLRDANEQLLLGPEGLSDGVRWLPIEKNDRLLGYLGFYKTQEITEELDRVFLQRIQGSFVWSVILVLIIATLFTWMLNRWLLKPLLKLRATTQQIGGGDLGRQIELKQKDELGELANDLNRLSQTLDENRKARRKWVADISHELRTPVAILKGELEAIEDGIRTFDNNSLESLIQEVARLSLLIDDLHQLSMADAGDFKLVVEPLSLAELLHELVENNQGRLDQHNATIRIVDLTDEAIVKGDGQRLNQLFNNLLENSLAYSAPPCQIVVDASIENDWEVINWQDSAPSVEPEKLEFLFERLYRGEASRNRTSGGSGLGLSIVKSLVELHGGNISASQSNLGGIAIKIRLPLANGSMRNNNETTKR